jgi:hypothetical protein
MARGWESKSVEEQQSQLAETRSNPTSKPTPDELAKCRLRDGLILNRKRILQQLQTTSSPQHRSMLESALAHLDGQIASLN